MTPDEFKALTPRQMDAWIAEHLFDLPDVRLGVARYWYTPTDCGYTPDAGKIPPSDHDSKQDYVYRRAANAWEFVPHYSTTGNGMLLVIEKMRERGYGLDECRHPAGRDAYAKFFADYDRDGGSSEAASLPGAVALAAFAAITAGKE